RTVLEEMAHDAEVLGELLGSEHDLDFLWGRLKKECGDQLLGSELARLQKLINKRCKRLRHDALELGRRFYAEPSKAFAKRISILPANERRTVSSAQSAVVSFKILDARARIENDYTFTGPDFFS